MTASLHHLRGGLPNGLNRFEDRNLDAPPGKLQEPERNRGARVLHCTGRDSAYRRLINAKRLGKTVLAQRTLFADPSQKRRPGYVDDILHGSA